MLKRNKKLHFFFKKGKIEIKYMEKNKHKQHIKQNIKKVTKYIAKKSKQFNCKHQ